MNRKVLGAVFGLGWAVAACATGDAPTAGDESALNAGNPAQPSSDESIQTASICAGGRFRCFAQIQVGTNGQPLHFAGPSGLGATDLQDAYKLDATLDPGATIAIIDAFGYAKAEADLNVYRAQYGLGKCTVDNGCLTIVNQDGAASPLPPEPPSNDDWTTETALDLDMASAACPKCKLLLVQANSDQDDGLFIAQATAARLGATVISDSWGTSETADDPVTSYEHYFDLPNVGIFVASGDSGYNNGGSGPDYPSTSAHVTAVGGTNLKKVGSGSRGWTEKAWGGLFSSLFGAGGSACGLSVPKPSYQGNTACNFRAASDVAAVGDPLTAPAIYHSGWTAVGGTSAAAPLVAGIYALTGHGREAPSFSYEHTAAYWDVSTGSNGKCKNVLCNAGRGWDGPTGNGTPNGAALAAIH